MHHAWKILLIFGHSLENNMDLNDIESEINIFINILVDGVRKGT